MVGTLCASCAHLATALLLLLRSQLLGTLCVRGTTWQVDSLAEGHHLEALLQGTKVLLFLLGQAQQLHKLLLAGLVRAAGAAAVDCKDRRVLPVKARWLLVLLLSILLGLSACVLLPLLLAALLLSFPGLLLLCLLPGLLVPLGPCLLLVVLLGLCLLGELLLGPLLLCLLRHISSKVCHQVIDGLLCTFSDLESTDLRGMTASANRNTCRIEKAWDLQQSTLQCPCNAFNAEQPVLGHHA
jgi:hypothetical protein